MPWPLHTRTIFYVGGHYQNLDTGSRFGKGDVIVEQMYVEQLTPDKVLHEYPVVFWHGFSQTGASWLNTPDGRPGWAQCFLSKGYIVFLVDTAECGRSSWLPGSNELVSVPSAYVQKYWTATQNSTTIWPQASLHTQWPGTGTLGDPVFDAFIASQVQSRSDQLTSEQLARENGAALMDKIGPAILITHSQGGAHGWGIGEYRPELVKAIVAIEPLGPPFVPAVVGGSSRPYGLSALPLTYDPPISDPAELLNITVTSNVSTRSDCTLQAEPPRRLKNLSRFPVLVVTSEAGYHSMYDYCTVEFLKQAGVEAEWLNLPESGIHGNGHFMFLEKNNMEIAILIEKWVAKQNSRSR